MPFCTQCGSQVGADTAFCGGCGARQAGGSPKPSGPQKSASDFLNTVTPHNASVLCYVPVVGWIACIVVLAANRFRNDRDVRFHAFQGLYIFVIWLFADWVFGPITAYAEATRFIGKALKAMVLCAWIFMLVKTSQGAMFRLPIIGELADRSVSEQK
ncbi:MAG: hypothetical protein HY858_08625 [Candidatus Solibacter usitatus]|nr:hypothetical protein [Candidatus Solibacter usitatus]